MQSRGTYLVRTTARASVGNEIVIFTPKWGVFTLKHQLMLWKLHPMLFKRKSYQAIDKIYFWTATIHEWYPILDDPDNKKMIIEFLQHFNNAKLITIYGFVLMPNHIHLIWKQNERNGQEMPLSSFMKYTAKKLLLYSN